MNYEPENDFGKLLNQFEERWNDRGDIGLTKEEILQFIRDAHETGQDEIRKSDY